MVDICAITRAWSKPRIIRGGGFSLETMRASASFFR